VTTAVTDFVIVDNFVTIFSDDFETPQGWAVDVLGDPSGASTGQWERAVPQATSSGGFPVQPGADHTPGAGTMAFVTGAAGGNAGTADVDGGSTTVRSPMLSTLPYDRVYVSYARWYSNNRGAGAGDDVLAVEVSVDAGMSWTTLERPGESMLDYREPLFLLDDFVAPGFTVFFRFIASDLNEGSLVEAVLDDFSLVGVLLPDGDSDFVPDSRDNCPESFNPFQDDLDGDGAGDACDCAMADPTLRFAATEVTDVAVTHVPGTTTINWTDQGPTAGSSTVHDIISGLLSDLDATGDYSAAACLAADLSGSPTLDTTSSPAVGDGVYYGVRAHNACGVGSYGDSTLAVDPRDGLDAASPCP
jgi:hypothetical protein